jgi:hypothetical protein
MEVPVILSHGLHHVIVDGTLGHSLAICRPAYAHLARFIRYASNIPGTQDEAARLIDDIFSPIPIDPKFRKPNS